MSDADHPSGDGQLARLMAAAQAGDAQAYVVLLEAVVPRVRGAVQRQRGFAGREDVEDLVQDVLLSLHVARATYDSARPFMPWLMAIVRHRLGDGARRYVRQAAHEVAVDDVAVTFANVATNTLDEEVGDTGALKECGWHVACRPAAGDRVAQNARDVTQGGGCGDRREQRCVEGRDAPSDDGVASDLGWW